MKAITLAALLMACQIATPATPSAMTVPTAVAIAAIVGQSTVTSQPDGSRVVKLLEWTLRPLCVWAVATHTHHSPRPHWTGAVVVSQ